MKHLKFLIAVWCILMAQVAFAVTLPSTSYSPGIGGDGAYSGVFSAPAGTMYSGSFSALGDQDPPSTVDCEDDCNSTATGCVIACAGNDACIQGCLETAQSCIETCMGDNIDPLDGDASPLDESTLLLIMVCAAAFGVSIFKYHKQHQL